MHNEKPIACLPATNKKESNRNWSFVKEVCLRYLEVLVLQAPGLSLHSPALRRSSEVITVGNLQAARTTWCSVEVSIIALFLPSFLILHALSGTSSALLSAPDNLVRRQLMAVYNSFSTI